MTRDELQKLIGGYATGSLTEAEKSALFEAALDDQELFDELAREQVLKEMLDQPGAKSRLIAALAPSSNPHWWRRLVIAGIAAATLASFVAVYVFRGRPAVDHVDIARVEPAPAPGPQEIPKAIPEQAPKQVSKQKAANAPVVPTPERAAPASAPAAAPPPAPAAERAQAEARDRGLAAGTIAPMVSQFRAKAAAPLSFDYSLGDTELTLHFPSDGYFSIHFSPGQDTIVDSRVAAGTTRRLAIPNNATEAAIVFSAVPQSTSGGVSLARDTKTGTVDDPSGQRIELLLHFYP